MPIYKRSYLEIELENQFEKAGLPLPTTEYKFMKTRAFRFDFAYPNIKMAIEVEGGKWGGRHTRGDGFERDCFKYNEAACLGWYVIRVTKDMIEDGDLLKPSTAIQFIVKMYKYLMSKNYNNEVLQQQHGKKKVQKS